MRGWYPSGGRDASRTRAQPTRQPGAAHLLGMEWLGIEWRSENGRSLLRAQRLVCVLPKNTTSTVGPSRAARPSV